MNWIFNDGGREAAGYKGFTGDCVVRAIAIAAELDYKKVYNDLFELERGVLSRARHPKKKKRRATPRAGIHKESCRAYMEELGWRWTPTMKIGSGCRVHLATDELPSGRLVVVLSRHLTAVVDGVIHDTYDPSRQTLEVIGGVKSIRETRCVYGYYQLGDGIPALKK